MTEEIIIDIQVSEVAQQLANTTAQIQALKKEQKDLSNTKNELNKTTAEGAKIYAENTAKIKDLTAQEKIYTQQIAATTKTNVELNDSMAAQERELDNLKAQYASLSSTQKNTAGGQAMKKSIDELDKSVKENRKSIGDNQRSVGDYTESIKEALGRNNSFIASFLNLTKGAEGSAGGFKAAANGVVGFTKSSLAFIATPIGAVLAVIAVSAKLLIDAFKKNDQALTALQKGAAAFKPVMEAVEWVFVEVAKAIGSTVEAIGSVINAFSDASDEASKLVEAQDKLEESERNYVVNSAKRNSEIAELRDKAVSKDKYTAAQRQKFLEEAIAKEKQNLADKQANAIEAERIIKATAKEENDTSDETADKIAQAEAKKYQAQEEYYTGVRKLNKQLQAAIEEQAAEEAEIEKKKAEERKKRQEAYKKLLENSNKIAADLVDARIQNERKGIDLQIEQEKIATQRKIEELKKQTELTAEGIKKRNALIIELQKLSNTKIAELEKQKSDEAEAKRKEEIAKEFETQQKHLQILLDGVKKESNEELDLRLQAIDNLRKKELSNQELTNEERSAINEKYRMQEEEATLSYQDKLHQKEIDKLTTDLNNKLELTNQFSSEELEIKTQQLELQRQAEVEAAEKSGADVSLINQKYAKATIELQKQTEKAKLDATSNVLGQAAALFEENTTAYKGIASAQALIDTYAAAQAAYKSQIGIAVVGPVLAPIAAGLAVASGLKNVAAINKIKFAYGGVVPGSGVGDSVNASLTPGEMILTKENQINLLKSLSYTPTASGMDYNALASAMQNIHPIVSVSEINDVNSRVEVLDNLSNV